MSDQPEFHFEVTSEEIGAANRPPRLRVVMHPRLPPALAQFLRKQNTNALVKGSTLPRSRRPVGTRRHRNH